MFTHPSQAFVKGRAETGSNDSPKLNDMAWYRMALVQETPKHVFDRSYGNT